MKKYRNYIIAAVILIIAIVTICFVPISTSKLIPRFEEQISADLGVKVHMERLVLQLGPMLKVKTPVMHMMYEDGQKFAQLNTVKFYIPWASIFKNKPVANSLYAKNLLVRVNSDDKYLEDFLNNIKNKDYSEIPNLHVKNYKISYKDIALNNVYTIAGQEIDTSKIINFKNFKLNTKGSFLINDKPYINYDIVVTPKMDIDTRSKNLDFGLIVKQIKELDFESDIIADLKLYKTEDEALQASGFINIDNISVLDPKKKDPKSFIYLTLLGDKASVLSNIYTAPNKKIYVEGMVNNSKKPVLDIKVKTDKISLNDLHKKMKIFTDFSDIMRGIDELSGLMDANFTLKGDLNKIKSNGFMKITDASIKASGIVINNINSDIDFSNNTINIANATGMVKNSPIMLKGAIGKDINLELLADKAELKFLCPTVWGVKEGVLSLVANITGTIDNIVHKENIQISGLKLENKDNLLSVESLKFDTNKNNIAYIENVSGKTPEIDLIKLPSLKLQVDADKISIPDTNIFMPNSKLILKGDVLNYNNNDVSFNINLNGFISSSDIKSLKKYPAKYPLQVILNGNRLVQNINSQILLENALIFDEPSVINLVAKVEDNSIKIEDFSAVGHSGSFTDDFKSNLKGTKKIVITGNIDNLKEPVLKNIRIITPQQLNVDIFDTIVQLKGDLFINGKYETPDIVGQVTVQNLVNKQAQLSLSSCTADFNKNVATINAPNIKIGDSVLGINTNLTTNNLKTVILKNLNVKSKYINPSTLLMYKDVPLLSNIPVEIQNGKFYAERLNFDLYGKIANLTAFSSDITYKDHILNLKNIASEMFNGKLGGSVVFDDKNETFDSKIMARGVSAGPIFDLISNRKDTINGVMDFDAIFKGNLNSMQSLSGDLKFLVKNGRMSTLGKLEHLLYAQNVVADSMLRTSLSVVTKAITLKDTGLFKYLRGDIHLANGMANIKMLQSQGPQMSLFIKGQYNPENDYAKLVVLGRLSDDVISGLGAFGDFSFNKLMVMLTGEDSKYNISVNDLEYLPQLQAKNTKEFRSIINGPIDKPSSVLLFNWISYSQKSLRQKEVPMTDIKVPSFVDNLPY